jgi:hypothetical protein
MKVSTENDNNFGYEKITIVVDNIPLIYNNTFHYLMSRNSDHSCSEWFDHISLNLAALTKGHSLALTKGTIDLSA